MTDTTSQDGLARLRKLAAQQTQAEQEVTRLETELAEANKVLDQIAENDIPDLIDNLYPEAPAKFVLQVGDLKITVSEKVRCGQLKSPAGLQWLRENGQGGLIKSQVVVPFTRGTDSEAQALVDRLAGDGMAARHEAFVPWNSLAASVKSMRQDGDEVDEKVLGVWDQRRAKVDGK